jgi:acetyl-CoA/propionyl-CoA carboxylase, biotin carboxylase, biotin carboxyl carrier protein
MTTGRLSRVLIANRGEIAVRIINTLRTLRVGSVVVYHDDERDSLAVREADAAVEILGATPVAAYLDGAQIIQAALRAGADAIHPGYGFLSENADFAEAVAAAGLVFIGPRPDTIRLMGDKLASRDFVETHGFPVAPSASEGDDPATFLERAAAVGFPLLVKASAGGGGKAMHIVRSAEDLEARVNTARSEAQRYFGDGRVYCERYIDEPRHIEVQVLADAYGNCIHLFERECSVQRRFQKIIEETPSPALTPELRRTICETAVGIARASGYLNAGTIEFILAPGGEFYFLEMNTRLQVEHPVTESVTGIDLVAEQVHVALGEPLRFQQAQVSQSGHAIECRIYAEDADAGFLPATGRLLALQQPSGPGIRVDGGLVEGQSVTAAFDPMLAKLIVHASDRGHAIERMRAALRQFVVLGVTTNIAFLDRVLGHDAFAGGKVHTGFVEGRAEELREAEPDAELLCLILAAAAVNHREFRDLAASLPEPYASMGPWRN